MTKSNEQIALEVAEAKERSLIDELNFTRMYIDKLRRDLGMPPKSNSDVKVTLNRPSNDATIEIPPIVTDRPINYKSDLGLAKKFAVILKHYNRFLHFREVADIINKLDDTDTDTGVLTSRISTSVQSLKEKQIFKYQAKGGHRNTFWGLRDWLNEDGTIKQGHEYNEDYMHKSDSESLF